MDILGLLEASEEEIRTVVSNPLAMLGPPEQPNLGLRLMPERLVDMNQFEETRINYKTVVANNERMVWECVVDAAVQIEGDDGFKETVAISDPEGHRVASGDWDDPDYNPLDDIYARADFLKTKGIRATRQIAGTPVVNKLLSHPKVITAARGFITVDAGGAIVG